MNLALEKATLGMNLRESVPVGSLVVLNDEIISSSHNSQKKSIMHAELNSIMIAMNKLNSRYLDKCEIFITHEPCEMCYNAILISRIKRVFFGSYSDKNFKERSKIEYYGGVLVENSIALVQDFFNKKRKKNTIDLLKI